MVFSPGEVAAALVARLFPGETAHTEALTGGITNSNFKVAVGARSVVVRVPGRRTELLGIDRSVEAAASRIAALTGVGPEVLAFDEATGCIVTAFLDGVPVAPDVLAAEPLLGEVVAAIRRVHTAGQVPAIFDPYSVVARYHSEITARGGAEPFDYGRMAALLGQMAEGCPLRPTVLGHNDLLNSNLIHDGAIRILDWEYAGMTDPYFDLANFSVNNELGEERDEAVLAHYFGSPTPHGLARLRLMKLASEAREAMWAALQLVISDLEIDFAAYGRGRAERFFALADHLDVPSLLAAA
jgi:thiamine kinase-like enzyme